MGVRQDERTYDDSSEVPVLGSIHRISTEKNGVAHYQCLSEDTDKLPEYAMIGSDCIVVDTGDVWIKHDEWRMI